MADTFRARLERAFETLNKQGVTPLLRMTGCSALSEWDDIHFRDLARAAGTPDSWVGAGVGAEEDGGGYWDAHGVLRYRLGGAAVTRLTFTAPNSRCGILLVDALADEGLDPRWTGHHLVHLHLDDAYIRSGDRT